MRQSMRHNIIFKFACVTGFVIFLVPLLYHVVVCVSIRSVIDHSGQPVDHSGQPVDHSGQPVDHSGQPVDHSGQSVNHSG